jgi:hypothetical protein
MAKLKLLAEPTFKAKVGIPVAGGESVPVEMTFRHRTKAQLDAFIKNRADKTDTESFMDMVTGWELEDAFTEANVSTLLDNYIGAALATFEAYIDELVKARVKN